MRRRGRKEFKETINQHEFDTECHNLLTSVFIDIELCHEFESKCLKMRRPPSASERRQRKNMQKLSGEILRMHDLHLSKEFTS